MDWEKIKKIFIYLLVAVNIGLLGLNYKNSTKYTMTSDEERAVYELLSANGIGIYTEIIKEAYPMRQLAVTVPEFNNNEIRNTFFDNGENVQITLEFDSTIFKSDSKTVVINGNKIYFDCPDGTGNIEDFSRQVALDISEDFIKKVSFGSDYSINLEKISVFGDGYKFEYNESYGKQKIFSSAKEVYVTPEGIISAELSYYVPQGYVGENRQICSCDEAILTVIYNIKNSVDGVPDGAYLEKTEIGYDFQADGDISQAGVLRLVPCYRIYISGINNPYIVNAYTNELIEY